jgi:hypothetical protein
LCKERLPKVSITVRGEGQTVNARFDKRTNGRTGMLSPNLHAKGRQCVEGELRMTRDQKIVAMGAASGVAAMIVLVWLLARIIPTPAIADTPGDRIAYALRWALVAVLPLLLMIAAVGNARAMSEAIDPTLGKESRTMMIDGHVLDNTLQQFILFLVAMLALSVTLPLGRLSIVGAVAITFVVMRVAFWIGYRIKPVYRAFGFASTFYMNLGMLVASLWLWLQ